MMQILPGFGGGSPPPVQTLPTVPTAEDPAVKAAREKQRLMSVANQGRAATVLVPDEEKLGLPNVDRPTARGASVLFG